MTFDPWPKRMPPRPAVLSPATVRCAGGATALAATLLATACATAPPPGDPVREVDTAAVQACTRLEELTVRTMRDSGSPAADLERAKERLLADARERGATHMVVTERDLRFALATARGVAYRCG